MADIVEHTDSRGGSPRSSSSGDTPTNHGGVSWEDIKFSQIRKASIAEAFEKMCLSKIDCIGQLPKGVMSKREKEKSLKGSPSRKKATLKKGGTSAVNIDTESPTMQCLDFSTWPEEDDCMVALIRKLCGDTFRSSRSTLQEPICFRLRRTRLGAGLLQAMTLASKDPVMSTVLARVTCIDICECGVITWPDLKHLLSCLPNISALIMRGNPWLNDDIVEQICIKYNKQLRYVDLENTPVTDNSLHHMAKKCPNVQALVVNHCSKIGNKGFAELRKLALRSLMLSHNLDCDDASINVVLSNSGMLHHLRFINCPKLTDSTITALFEANVSWGKKRNERSAELQALELAGNNNVTHHSLLYLSTAVPRLSVLDLSECHSVHLTEALHEMENFTNLETLKIGPCAVAIDPDAVVSSLLGHMHNLQTLHMSGLVDLKDEDIAELIDAAIVLSDISLTDMNVGTKTIESISSTVPNIEKLAISGSPLLTDTDMRCVTAICVRIKFLTVHHCVALTDKAFSRCVLMRFIEYLDLAYCSPQLNGSLLTFFAVGPLRYVNLDGLQVNMLSGTTSRINKRLYRSLKKLSLRESHCLDGPTVHKLLSHFVALDELDLTGNHHLELWLREYPKKSLPFLRAQSTLNFMGFAGSDFDKIRSMQYWAICNCLQRAGHARTIQLMAKRRAAFHREQKRKHEVFMNEVRARCATILVATVRMFLTRRRVRIKLLAGRQIVIYARWFLLGVYMRKSLKARRHRENALKRFLFFWIKTVAQRSRRELLRRAGILNPKLLRNLQRRTLDTLVMQEAIQLDAKLQGGAEVMYEYHFKKRIIDAWKTMRGGGQRRLDYLTTVWMNCLAIESHNSIRQQSNLLMAEQFSLRRFLIPGWRAFQNDYEKARRTEDMLPKAIAHFENKFLDRVVRASITSMAWYRNERHLKKELKQRADDYLRKKSRKLVVQRFKENVVRCRFHERMNKKAAKHAINFLKQVAFSNRLPAWVAWSKYVRAVQEDITDFLHDKYTEDGMKDFKRGCIWSKLWRGLVAKAKYKFLQIEGRKFFDKWQIYTDFSKNMDTFVENKYKEGIKRKTFGVLKKGLMDKKNYMANLEAQMAADAEAAEEAKQQMVIMLRGVSRFQARVRGGITRTWFREWSINAQFARQTMQNFARKAIALLRVRKIRRVLKAQSFAREEREREAMQDADLETQYFEYHLRAIMDIQRCFRGWKGRLEGLSIAVDFQKQRVLLKLAGVYRLKEKYLVNKEKANELDRVRKKAATQIQRMGRGLVARKAFVKLKKEARKEEMTIVVQKNYRMRIAFMERLANKRNFMSSNRFHQALRQRAMILRGLGFSKRKAQKFIATNFLSGAGVDPITYNYRVEELWEETKADFFEFRAAIEREWNLYNEVGRNKILLQAGRRKILQGQGWNIVMYDAVRIVQQGHKYQGETGIVVRVDSSVPGTPLYEVKLDRNGVQTFVNMTTDALTTYMDSQPLVKITKDPKLEGFFETRVPEIYGLNTDNPFFDGNNIDAAWTIQRAWRCHRARDEAARKRYEAWMRLIDQQKEFINLLGDHNALTAQGNIFMKYLGLKPKRQIFFDEIRHELSPPGLRQEKKASENVAVLMELEEKIKERSAFVENSAVLGKEFFYIGYERLTFYRKMKFFLSKTVGLMGKKDGPGLKDLRGSKGAMFLASQESMVTGMDRYVFSELRGSPHVRYSKLSLYQGHWSGIPYVTKLKPHGEGVCIFMDGWGFAKEDKTLFITIIACRYLNAADMTTSDPYCNLSCNGRNLQTTVKWKNLNPTYYESFEIDVTNPSAKLNIAVYDKDYIGDDDLLGQIVMPLAEVEDGEVHHKTVLLRGEDPTVDEDFDRGEIEFRVQWKERAFEDDVAKAQLKVQKAIQVQAWARRLAANTELKRIRKEKEKLLQLVARSIIQMQCFVRQRQARKWRNFLRKRWRMAHKLQKRWWIFVARRELKRRQNQKVAAIIIQALIRGFLGKCRFAKYKHNRDEGLRLSATCIQKYARRKLAIRIVRDRRTEFFAAMQDDEDYIVEPVREWLPHYGTDPDYGLRRSRRITERIFQKVLRTKYARVVCKPFGSVFVDSCPPADGGGYERDVPQVVVDPDNPEAEQAKNMYTNDNFALCYMTPVNPNIVHRKEAVKVIDERPYPMVVHVPSSILLRESVFLYVLRLQCLVRQKQARKARDFMLGVSAIFAKFQRHFRRRNEGLHRAAFKVQALFHSIRAKLRTHFQRREIYGVRSIQGGVRTWLARLKAFNLRCVRGVKVFKAPPSLDLHGPEKLVDFKSASFWMNMGYEHAELRMELPQPEKINQIAIMVGLDSASARYVRIEALADKMTKKYVTVVERTELFEKGRRWHFFSFENIMAKYYKIYFEENAGDEDHLAVRQVRFVRAKEISATIIHQPKDYIFVDDGPLVSHKRQVMLKIDAIGWPMPSYQWFCNEQEISGATKHFLNLTLFCPLDRKRRPFRCLRCKMVCKAVPINCYHVTCGNCSNPFEYKDILEYEQKLKVIKEKEEEDKEDKDKMENQLIQMKLSEDPRVKEQIPFVEKRIVELQGEIFLARQNRCILKASLENCNKYSNEGVYTCRVTNYRGGDILITRMSDPAVIFVEHSEPYILRVVPSYVPRGQGLRKKWTTYSSLKCHFNRGKIEGIVTIRFQDKAFYEGPYVPEKFLKANGETDEIGRMEGHYGIYTCPDGVVFEGSLVDNHFDPYNLQKFYRMTRKNGEVYEGSFIDEEFHGFGTYSYKNGSVYEGEWHRGCRFGYGHMRNVPEDYIYEGYYDSDRRHGEGIISWGNGAFYMGRWDYDMITGRGVYISALSDVYKGTLKDGKFDGHGSMLYSNGSRYYGEFKNGMRHGKGVFMDRTGAEFYGHFKDDKKDGEFVVKSIVQIEEPGQNCFEIKIGEYNMGKFVKWKSKFANPLATRQFIKLFDRNKEMFDSVYALIVAKNLPNVPPGIDSNHVDVQRIVEKLSAESGELVGKKAMADANTRVFELVEPLRVKEEEISHINSRIDELSLQIIKLEGERQVLMRTFNTLMFKVDKEYKRIEQFWFDDKSNARAKFQLACKNLEQAEKDDWFVFKNHRIPPPFNKKIMDAISILLKTSLDWKVQQTIVSDSVFNSRLNDDSALRFNYICKLVHLMKEYDVFEFADGPEPAELIRVVSDPRFRRDSYYIEACGKVGPLLVDWVKTNAYYLRLARLLYASKMQADAVKADAFRQKAIHTKKTEEQKKLQAELDELSKKLAEEDLILGDLRAAMAHADGMIRFVRENLKGQRLDTKRPDYYQVLEAKIEEKRDRFMCETRMELMLEEVEKRMEDYEKAKQAEARMVMRKYEQEQLKGMHVKDRLKEDISMRQDSALSAGYTLGYNIEPETNTYPDDMKKEDIKVAVQTVANELNSAYNDSAFARQWTMLDGRILTIRLIYVLAWKYWKDLAVARVELEAVAAWEEIFGDEEACAVAAVEGRVNERMSKVAREQGRVWARYNKSAIVVAEVELCKAFDEANKGDDEAKATRALEMVDDDTGSTPPKERAKASCWAKLNPDAVHMVREQQNVDAADEFALAMGQSVGEKCVQIMNGIAEEEFMHWAEKAHHWRNLNFSDYIQQEKTMVDTAAEIFSKDFDENTADMACKIAENAAIAKHMVDEESMKEREMVYEPEVVFQSKCWGTRNQGKMRTATASLRKTLNTSLHYDWMDLKDKTEKFVKGSYLTTPKELKLKPADDRFFGFRQRLESQFDWMHAYLLKREQDLTDEIIKLEINNPIGKEHANVRPSEKEKYVRKVENDYLQERNRAEQTLADILSKLSQWNAYFGTIERAEKQAAAKKGMGGGGDDAPSEDTA